MTGRYNSGRMQKYGDIGKLFAGYVWKAVVPILGGMHPPPTFRLHPPTFGVGRSAH